MKKVVIFNWNGNETQVSADAIVLPRIGEKIYIGGLLASNEERKAFNAWQNGQVFVVDIFHNFDADCQAIEVYLSNDVEHERNDFYTYISGKI